MSYGRPLRLLLTGRTKGKDLGYGATEDKRERHAKKSAPMQKHIHIFIWTVAGMIVIAIYIT